VFAKQKKTEESSNNYCHHGLAHQLAADRAQEGVGLRRHSFFSVVPQLSVSDTSLSFLQLDPQLRQLPRIQALDAGAAQTRKLLPQACQLVPCV